MRFLVLGAAILLAGCVPDSAKLSVQRGHWTDYHDLSHSIGASVVANQSAPQEVKDRFATCFADYVVKAFKPEELSRLDAYARGDIQLSAGELRQYDELSNQRMNGSKLTSETLNRFDTTCPQDVPDFQRYFRL